MGVLFFSDELVFLRIFLMGLAVDMKKNASLNFMRSEGVFLAIFPFVGYYMAFVFEVGWLDFYGVPYDLIRIDIPQLIFSSISFAFLCVLLNVVFDAMVVLFALGGVFAQALTMPLVCSVFLGGVMLMVPGHSEKWYVLFLFFAFFSVARLLAPFCNKKYNGSYMETIRAEVSEEEVQSIARRNNYNFFNLKLILAVLFFGSFTVFSLGRWWAENKVNYYVVDDDFSSVMVANYGDIFIFKKIDLTLKKIGDGVIVVKLGDGKVMNLTEKKIGKLVSANNMKM